MPSEYLRFQCPCGQRFGVLFARLRRGSPVVTFWALGDSGQKPRKVAGRCPSCDRDFSQYTAAEIKEQVWGQS